MSSTAEKEPAGTRKTGTLSQKTRFQTEALRAEMTTTLVFDGGAETYLA